MRRFNCMHTLLSKVEFAGILLCWDRPFLYKELQCLEKCISREKWSRLGLQELLLQSLERPGIFKGTGSGVGKLKNLWSFKKNGNMVMESHYPELTLTSQSCFKGK